MKYLRSKAIILEIKAISQYDLKITLFTKEYGLLDVFVRSGRKPKSKLGLSLAEFSVVEVMMINGKRNYQLCGIKTDKCYFNLIKDSSLLNFILLCALKEFFQVAFKSGSKEPEVFKQLKKFLEKISNLEQDKIFQKILIFNQFIFQILDSLGYFSFKVLDEHPKISENNKNLIRSILIKDKKDRVEKITKKDIYWLNQYLYNEVLKVTEKPVNSFVYLKNYLLI